jgi:hypothetical protein
VLTIINGPLNFQHILENLVPLTLQEMNFLPRRVDTRNWTNGLVPLTKEPLIQRHRGQMMLGIDLVCILHYMCIDYLYQNTLTNFTGNIVLIGVRDFIRCVASRMAIPEHHMYYPGYAASRKARNQRDRYTISNKEYQ